MFTPKEQQPPPPPADLRPWYYRNWFLIPAFVLGWPIVPETSILWPLWAVLIIKSPWHNGILSGGLAWAMIMTGGYLLVSRAGSSPGATAALLLPGVALTVLTHVHWSKYKHILRAATPAAVEDSTQDSPPHASGEDPPEPASDDAAPRFHPTRGRRRSQRARGYRSGRQPPPPSS